MASAIRSSPLSKYSVGSTTIIKNITKEVLREFAKLDVYLDETVVSLAVRLLSLDPGNGLQLDQSYDRRDLETFVSNCVERLKDTSKPWVKTLCMQVLFVERPIDSERIIQHQENLTKEKTNKLTTDILTAQSKSEVEREKLFKKITVDIIVNNFLGNPSNKELFAEISAALSSVLSKEHLVHFVGLKSDARLNLVQQYRSIVCGIYIYNKDSGLCGADMIDVATVVLSGHAATESQLNIALDEVGARIKLLTTVLGKHRDVLGASQDVPIANTDCGNLQDLLIMLKQNCEYVKSHMRSLTKTKAEIDHVLKAFKAKLIFIRERVQFKTAIPTNEIFPHFEDLCACWRRLQNYIFIVSEIKIVHERLFELIDEVPEWENTAMDLLSTPSQLQNQVETIDTETKIVSQNPNVQVIEYKTNLKLEFAGFCPVCLSKGGGYLQPVNFDIGVCVFRDMNYAFRSCVAAKTFLQNPESLIFSVVETARAHPELIFLLDIFDLVKSHRHDFHGTMKRSVMPRLVSGDASCQTELHPVPAHYDSQYMWNMWDYRRKAIQYANLLSMRTTSVQTAVGYQRFGVETQTWSPREADAQTRRDAATMVPVPMRFVRGVRGTDGDRCRDVNLTEYVEDDVRAYDIAEERTQSKK